jgi:hypothetical protein
MWKKHSNWRKSKAQHLRSLRFMILFGWPLEQLWNGRKRSEVK